MTAAIRLAALACALVAVSVVLGAVLMEARR